MASHEFEDVFRKVARGKLKPRATTPAIVDALRQSGPMGVNELSAKTGLKYNCVMDTLKRGVRNGQVILTGKAQRGNRRFRLYAAPPLREKVKVY